LACVLPRPSPINDGVSEPASPPDEPGPTSPTNGSRSPGGSAAEQSEPARAGWSYDRAVIDQSTEFGARVARHLRDEIVWLTSVTPAGSPLPSPVWFLWDGAQSVVMYSMPGARVRNIEANPRVALNFAGDGRGGDIVVLSGTAAVDAGAPPASGGDYLAKYAEHIARIGMTPETFAERYSVPVGIQLTGVRGH
jgi:PPOX class probable F420-dependent enzyme